MKTMATLGPIQRDAEIQSRLQALYDALQVSRVRWVLGVSLRRPWETAYPSHMPNPAAYDHTLTEILTEEFFRARVKNLMRQQGKLLQLIWGQARLFWSQRQFSTLTPPSPPR